MARVAADEAEGDHVRTLVAIVFAAASVEGFVNAFLERLRLTDEALQPTGSWAHHD
jgi:hypothetical protein